MARPDKEMSDFLAGIVGVVEATSYEQLCLWKEDHDRVKWELNPSGLMEIVGHLDDMPVCLSLTTATVDGHKLLFIDATSQVVDNRMIDKWLLETVPPSAMNERDGRYVNKVDAMNFHNVFRRKAADYIEKWVAIHATEAQYDGR